MQLMIGLSLIILGVSVGAMGILFNQAGLGIVINFLLSFIGGNFILLYFLEKM